MKEVIACLVDSIAKVAPIVVGAYLAYYFSYKSYRKQKGMEECRKKYLDEGLELCHSELAKVLASVEYNWTIAMNVLRQFRHVSGSSIKLSREDIRESFTPYFPQGFGFEYLDKVNHLIGDDVITRCTFRLLADLNGFMFFLKNDLDIAVEKFLKEPESCKAKPTSEEIAQEYKQALDKEKEKLEQYHALRNYVWKLTEVMRRKELSYETLEKIRCDNDVKEIISAVRDKYKSLLHPNSP
ncbi:MAG: hypothetical protein HY232_03855 [Acidobacteria bacterium]|nr:hypothetical protein [Acidobacteriota bacterium]